MTEETGIGTTNIWNQLQTANAGDFLFRWLTHHWSLKQGAVGRPAGVLWREGVWTAEVGDSQSENLQNPRLSEGQRDKNLERRNDKQNKHHPP